MQIFIFIFPNNPRKLIFIIKTDIIIIIYFIYIHCEAYPFYIPTIYDILPKLIQTKNHQINR